MSSTLWLAAAGFLLVSCVPPQPQKTMSVDEMKTCLAQVDQAVAKAPEQVKAALYLKLAEQARCISPAQPTVPRQRLFANPLLQGL